MSHHHHHPRHLQLIIKVLSRLRHLFRQSSLVPRLFLPRSSLVSRLLRPRSRRLRRRVSSLMLRRLLRALLLCKQILLYLFFLCNLDVVGRRLTLILLVGKTRKSLDTLVFAKVSITVHRLEVDAGGRRFRLLRIAVWIVCERLNYGRACYLGIFPSRAKDCFGAGTEWGLCARLACTRIMG